MRGLAGKRVVITGGPSGIDAAVSRFLDEESRILVLDRDPRGCKKIKAHLWWRRSSPTSPTIEPW